MLLSQINFSVVIWKLKTYITEVKWPFKIMLVLQPVSLNNVQWWV